MFCKKTEFLDDCLPKNVTEWVYLTSDFTYKPTDVHFKPKLRKSRSMVSLEDRIEKRAFILFHNPNKLSKGLRDLIKDDLHYVNFILLKK